MFAFTKHRAPCLLTAVEAVEIGIAGSSRTQVQKRDVLWPRCEWQENEKPQQGYNFWSAVCAGLIRFLGRFASGDFPKLIKFLDFWSANLDGKLAHVRVAHNSLITPAELRMVGSEFRLG